MSTYHRLPPFRNLDIYRLVVVRRLKQLDVAKSFSVDPSRISQVIRRIRDWVNDSIGDWLFPGRDDLRFYVALELEQIRVTELPENPETVTLTSPSRTYTRQFETATTSPHQPDAPAREHSVPPPETASPRPHQPDAPARSNPASLSPTDFESADAPSPLPDSRTRLNMTPQPINSAPPFTSDSLATTSDATTNSLTPDILQLGTHIAQLLILWKKHQKVSAALKPLGSSARKHVSPT